MDKLATGIVIALAALVLSGGFARDVMAGEVTSNADVTWQSALPSPAAGTSRGGLVVGLVLALEALRATPAVLNDRRASQRDAIGL